MIDAAADPAVNRLIDGIIEREGREYTDRWSDAGGPTKFGITEHEARAAGYAGDMRDMPESFARGVYLMQFYIAPGFARVATISQPIAAELTDTGVNMGPAMATTFLQRALNALNLEQKLYPDITVDGAIGFKTLGALRAFLLARQNLDGTRVLLTALNSLQACRYIELAERRQFDENNLFGWLRTRVAL